MRKLMRIVGGGAIAFALAIVVTRFALGAGGDTTIRLATSAPPIPVVGVAPSGASTIEPSPMANASTTEDVSSSSRNVAPAVAPATSKPAAASADGPSHFKVDPVQSSTKILVTQTSVLGDSLLVANGSNVTGDVFLTKNGRLGDSPSAFQLDLRALSSNDSELNSFLRNQLETGTYPYGQFAIASATGIPATYIDGPEFTFTMTGPLTMHGRTKSITWTARGRQAGEFLTVAADADFLLTDYGWTPPDYGVARAKNSVHIQVTIIARKDASGSGAQVRIATPASSSATDNAGPAPVAPSLSSSVPTSAPVLSSPMTSSAGVSDLAGATSASSLTSLLGGLGPLLTGNSKGGGLPSFSLDDLMKLLGGPGANNSPFGSGRK